MIGVFAPLRQTHPDLAAALKECRRAFLSVALFSGVVNMLMLAGPLYMLQVYDRVLSSRSVPTLVALSVFLVVAYGFQGGLEVVRSRLAVRIASLLDLRLDIFVHDAVIRLANRNASAAEAHQPVHDLDQIRAFLTGPGPIAIIDLPWMPIFLAICFLIHPWLGAMALAGAIILMILTILTQRRSRAPTLAMTQSAGARAAASELTRRSSETIAGMGMARTLAQRWQQVNDRYLAASALASDVAGSYGSVSRAMRLLLQSAMLGMGAYLVIRQELSAGAMFAASVMMGRALAPIDVVIANWRSLAGARQSLQRLSGTLRQLPARRTRTDLPKPVRGLDVEHVAVAAPNGDTAIVANVHFGLVAGEAAAIVGPSGAGKTSLVRSLIGVWPPARGQIRLDGAALDQWDEEALGRHVGYVGQNIEFFDGTIAENIARMSLAPDADAVLAAGRAAGRARHDSPPARRLRQQDRGSRHRALRRTASAHRARACALRRSVPGGARRAERQSRQRGRSRPAECSPRAQGARRNCGDHFAPADGAGAVRQDLSLGQWCATGLRPTRRHRAQAAGTAAAGGGSRQCRAAARTREDVGS